MSQFIDRNNATGLHGGLSGYVTEDELRSFFLCGYPWRHQSTMSLKRKYPNTSLNVPLQAYAKPEPSFCRATYSKPVQSAESCKSSRFTGGLRNVPVLREGVPWPQAARERLAGDLSKRQITMVRKYKDGSSLAVSAGDDPDLLDNLPDHVTTHCVIVFGLLSGPLHGMLGALTCIAVPSKRKAIGCVVCSPAFRYGSGVSRQGASAQILFDCTYCAKNYYAESDGPFTVSNFVRNDIKLPPGLSEDQVGTMAESAPRGGHFRDGRGASREPSASHPPPGSIDRVVAGTSCTGYSTLNKNREMDLERDQNESVGIII
ncbi:hypothetical protein NHQ30_009075 [Ciborinia camelliae]|nr:hypothetical protein NHQ30_009075 [Ciborinia camelliae]